MKKFRLLVCMLSLMSLAVLTACDDDDDDNGGNNNPPVTNDLVGQTMTVVVSESTGDPFVPAGETYTITFDTGSDYTFTPQGGEPLTGTYTFDRTGDTGTMVFDGGAITSTLTFTGNNTGTISSTDGAGGSETGTFTLSGP